MKLSKNSSHKVKTLPQSYNYTIKSSYSKLKYMYNVLKVANLKAQKWAYYGYVLLHIHLTGLEIATDTVANATKTLNLVTKNTSLVATLATMFL